MKEETKEELKKELREEKKKGVGSKIVIVLLILVVLGLVGYIAYDKELLSLGKKEASTEEKKSATTKKETKTNEEKLDVESSEVKDLYYNANNHLGVGIDEAIYNNSELKVSNMTDDYKMGLAYNIFKKDISSTSKGQYTIETVSEENVKAAYEKLFGPNTYSKVSEFKLYCANFKYNESQKIYEAVTGGCGGTSGFAEIDAILTATKYENRIEIVSGVVFVDAQTNALYKDYNKKAKIKDLTEDEMTNTLGNTWEDRFGTFIKENPDKVAKYTYTYELNKDGSYYYTGVKNTK